MSHDEQSVNGTKLASPPQPRPRAFVGRPAPDFVMASTKNLQTLADPVKLTDYAGRWLVLLFYPLDFTFVCPTELRGFSERYDAFKAEDAEVLGVSVDSVHTHRAWLTAPKNAGGLGELRYPLASDITHAVSRDYGVLLEDEGHSLRGTFLIDPEGVIQFLEITAEGIGRNAAELLRKVKAAQYVASHPGEVCPAKWEEGDETLAPSLDLVGKI